MTTLHLILAAVAKCRRGEITQNEMLQKADRSLLSERTLNPKAVRS